MANFPAGIRCSQLTYLTGEVPSQQHVSTAGNLLQIRASNRPAGGRLKVAFRGLSAAELATLRAHYQGEGTTSSWLLSSVLLDGAEFASEIETMRWRYASPPEARDITTDSHEYEFELEEAPVLPWQESYLLEARPATLTLGASINLLGPDTLPLIWGSRLTTAAWSGSANTPQGGAVIDPTSGESYQAFWFYEATESGYARIVAVKRNPTGNVLWQRWTNGTVGNSPYAGIDSQAVKVAPIAGGGCVVAAMVDRTSTIRVWRLAANGNEVWRKDVTQGGAGPLQILHSSVADEVLIGTTTVISSELVPALIRLSATDGSLLSCRAWTVDGVSTTYQRTLALASGRVLLLCRANSYDNTTAKKSYLLELSADLATVHASYGYGSSDPSGRPRTYDGPATVAANGDVLISSYDKSSALGGDGAGILRLNSSYSVQANRLYTRTTNNRLFDYPIEAASAAADGTVSAISYEATQSYFGQYGMSIGSFADNGATVTAVTEAKTALLYARGYAGVSTYQQIDVSASRCVMHASSSFDSPFACIAIGMAIPQLTDENGFTFNSGQAVAAKTIAAGSSSNGAAVSRYSISATGSTITPTIATGSLAMVDASSALSWELKRSYG